MTPAPRARGLARVMVAAAVGAMGCGADSVTAPRATDITVSAFAPAGATVHTESCGSLWILPLGAAFTASYGATVQDATVFAELVDDRGNRCAYGFSQFVDPMLPDTPTVFLVDRFLVAVEDVPSRCRYPAHVSALHATLLSGTGGVPQLPRLPTRVFAVDLNLVGSTDPMPAAGPCPP